MLARLAHSGATATERDTIADFTSGEDRIDLSDIDARSTNASPNDAFAFIGTAAFSGQAGQARYAVTGGYAVLELDVNGDGLADASLRLNGVTLLNAADFLL